jgi:hypothetical protein
MHAQRMRTPAAAGPRTATATTTTTTGAVRVAVAAQLRRRPAPAPASALSSSEAAAPSSSASPSTSSVPPSFGHGVTLCFHEGNSWHIKFQSSKARALVDPWLVGPLTFFDQAWLYTAEKKALRGDNSSPTPAIDVQAIADDTDVVLLSQYLDDHTHMPTLEALPRSLRVVAQPQAAERIASLGFKEVTPLSPGQSVVVADGRLRVTALAGSLVGPPWSARQNAYLLEELLPAEGEGAATATATATATPRRGASVFYEPHSDAPAETLRKAAPVDVLVGPSVDVTMGGYPLLKGKRDLAASLRALEARVFVPLANSELDHAGPLAEAMRVDGPRTAEATAAALRAEGLGNVHVEAPVPGEALSIPL